MCDKFTIILSISASIQLLIRFFLMNTATKFYKNYLISIIKLCFRLLKMRISINSFFTFMGHFYKTTLEDMIAIIFKCWDLYRRHLWDKKLFLALCAYICFSIHLSTSIEGAVKHKNILIKFSIQIPFDWKCNYINLK